MRPAQSGIVPLLLVIVTTSMDFLWNLRWVWPLSVQAQFIRDGFTQKPGGAFNWAPKAGYMFKNKIEVSARYQTGTSTGTTIEIFGLRLGYNFSLAGYKIIGSY